MRIRQSRKLLFAPALVLAAGTAQAQTHTAHFDGNSEGGIGTNYVEDGITFSDLDRYLGGSSDPFVAEDATTTLVGFPGFTSPMTLGFGGYSPGPSGAFSRCGTFKVTPPSPLDDASLHFYIAGGSSGGNTVTLEAKLAGAVVATDAFLIPGTFGPHHAELEVLGTDFDELMVIGTGPNNSGSFFALVDTVVLERGTSGTAYCFGDPGTGTSCPCGNENDGSVPGSGCANGSFASGALLVGSGMASVGSDTFRLGVSAVEPNEFGLFFHANNAVNGGNGMVFGDGLRCAGGGLVRFAVGQSDSQGDRQSTGGHGAGLAAGEVKRYQYWYRNPTSSPCGTNFNLSNGFEVTWMP